MRHLSELIVRMAQENPGWGYTRIQGALANLSHKVGRGTVANVLKRNGIEPSPERSKRTTWSTFLKAHWKVLAASDFLTVEVWTAKESSNNNLNTQARLSGALRLDAVVPFAMEFVALEVDGREVGCR